MTRAEYSANLRIAAWEFRVSRLRTQLETWPEKAYAASSCRRQFVVLGRSLASVKDDLTRAQGGSMDRRDSARRQFEALSEQYKAICEQQDHPLDPASFPAVHRACRQADVALREWIDAREGPA